MNSTEDDFKHHMATCLLTIMISAISRLKVQIDRLLKAQRKQF